MNRYKLPAAGGGWPATRASMADARSDDSPWYHERAFLGGSYFGSAEALQTANEAYQEHINLNALYARKSFPSLVHYEQQVVEMTLDLLNAPTSASGTLTSGGTESILLAVKTARDAALDNRTLPATPEILVPYAAHPAFHKAAHLMALRAVPVPCDGDYRVDVAAMAASITEATVLLVASAPSYPFGVTDDVAQIAALARERGVWLHVDACHGGFVLPFARKLGYPVLDYDFLVPGVTSLSVDIHKLGYANKGVSLFALRDADMHRYQHYEFSGWPAGVYATSALTGSRSGGGVASAWAVMNTLGEAGYLDIAAPILRAREDYINGINRIEGLQVRGAPDAYILSFGATRGIDIFAVADAMDARGWRASRLTDPPSIHLFLDSANARSVAAYLSDLSVVARAARTGKLRALQSDVIYST